MDYNKIAHATIVLKLDSSKKFFNSVKELEQYITNTNACPCDACVEKKLAYCFLSNPIEDEKIFGERRRNKNAWKTKYEF